MPLMAEEDYMVHRVLLLLLILGHREVAAGQVEHTMLLVEAEKK